eukprot:3037522-Rhodomonas_salina.2
MLHAKCLSAKLENSGWARLGDVDWHWQVRSGLEALALHLPPALGAAAVPGHVRRKVRPRFTQTQKDKDN